MVNGVSGVEEMARRLDKPMVRSAGGRAGEPGPPSAQRDLPGLTSYGWLTWLSPYSVSPVR